MPLTVGAILLSGPTAADVGGRFATTDRAAVHGPPGAFDVHLAREDLAVEYRDGSDGGDLELTHVGIAFHETLGDAVRGTVAAGGLGIRQHGREPTAAVDPTGWYLGLDFAGTWPTEGRVRLDAGLGWHYSRADRSDEEGNETILDWHTGEARAALVMGLTPAIGMRLGAAAMAVNGDERFLAEGSSTTRFDLDETTSAYLQLDFLTSDGGAIRFRVRGGNPRGAWIAFERNY